MQFRKMGKTGLEVSAVGFGTWAVGGNMWGPQDDKTTLETFSRAWDLGCNFFDTAAVYGDGHSEELLGRFIKATRHKPILATKIPPLTYEWPAREGTKLRDAFPKSHIVSQTEASLKRLKVDHVEIQQLHVWTDAWAGEDEWYEAMLRLREQGKIRFIGISLNSFDPDSGLEAARLGRVDVFQVVHNIFEQAPEDHLFPLCAEKGIGIIDRVPFDESSLTGKLSRTTQFPPDDFRARYFKGARLSETVDRAEALKWLVPANAASMPEAALRFCLSHEAVSTVIPGIRSVQQAEQNLSSADAGPLPKETLARLRSHRWDRRP